MQDFFVLLILSLKCKESLYVFINRVKWYYFIMIILKLQRVHPYWSLPTGSKILHSCQNFNIFPWLLTYSFLSLLSVILKLATLMRLTYWHKGRLKPPVEKMIWFNLEHRWEIIAKLSAMSNKLFKSWWKMKLPQYPLWENL